MAGGEVICSCWERGKCAERAGERERESNQQDNSHHHSFIHMYINEHGVQSTVTLHTE